jgi:hypothetical protein
VLASELPLTRNNTESLVGKEVNEQFYVLFDVECCVIVHLDCVVNLEQLNILRSLRHVSCRGNVSVPQLRYRKLELRHRNLENVVFHHLSKPVSQYSIENCVKVLAFVRKSSVWSTNHELVN